MNGNDLWFLPEPAGSAPADTLPRPRDEAHPGLDPADRRAAQSGLAVELAGTAQALGAPTLLTRIDPEQNMRRFYRLELSADLFGGVHLTREWGRIGRRGQSLTRWYETEAEATGFAELTLRAKRRRGAVSQRLV